MCKYGYVKYGTLIVPDLVKLWEVFHSKKYILDWFHDIFKVTAYKF